MKKAVLWLNRIVAVLTVIILIVVAGFTAPRLFGVKPFVVLSGSMEPTIPTGSCVFSRLIIWFCGWLDITE